MQPEAWHGLKVLPRRPDRFIGWLVCAPGPKPRSLSCGIAARAPGAVPTVAFARIVH